MSDELAMTTARRGMLDDVRRGAVTYDAGSGRWRTDGAVGAGWAGRTLSALRRAGYIELGGDVDPPQDGPVYTVGLTDKGRDALAS